MLMKAALVVMVAINLSSSSARVLSQSAVSSALQDILSPGNTDKVMQLIKMAASRSNNNPEIARAVACSESSMPAKFANSNYMPVRAVANERPIRVIAGDGYTRVVANPEMSIQKILRQAPVREMTRTVQPNMIDSLVLPKEIYQGFPMALPQENAIRPRQMPTPAFNPYLPAASPVSAISPGSMPPPTQSKGQFLRKIPIPPPTL